MAAAMAATIGLSYAELASAHPRAGADYEYTRLALGPKATLAFILAQTAALLPLEETPQSLVAAVR